MDHNELVEKAARAFDPEAFEEHPIEERSLPARLQWGARRKLATDAAERLVGSDFTDSLIEAVQAEAAQTVADWEPERGWNRSTAEPDEWEHETWQHNQELAAAIRAAVLGDALKGGK